MTLPIDRSISINEAMNSEYYNVRYLVTSITLYREDSLHVMVDQILTPIRDSFRDVNLRDLPDKSDHSKHFRKYKKILAGTSEIDHVEAANRSLGAAGLIGESGAEAIEARTRKTEWFRCISVTERIGKRLAAILKKNSALGDVLQVPCVARESSAYPLIVHLLHTIADELRNESKRPSEEI